ncbi:MAG: hypothetical protein Ct9H90mP2_06410 [Dehalococcoidia bacterium]|nr:MAG: hypothetical protein Ct9H90mP2_06410 [Dehalococcoidia bacterium]
MSGFGDEAKEFLKELGGFWGKNEPAFCITIKMNQQI